MPVTASHLQTLLREALAHEDVWAAVVKRLTTMSHRDISELKNEKTTVGDMWEDFCRLYLQQTGYTVHKLVEAPADVLRAVGLGRRDVGIDMIAHSAPRGACAVQCKFRRRGSISWREIATFEALCARSGPWAAHVVMTNAPSVRCKGHSDKDAALCGRTFAALNRPFWLRLAGLGEGRALGGDATAAPDAVRERFLRRVERVTTAAGRVQRRWRAIRARRRLLWHRASELLEDAERRRHYFLMTDALLDGEIAHERQCAAFDALARRWGLPTLDECGRMREAAFAT